VSMQWNTGGAWLSIFLGISILISGCAFSPSEPSRALPSLIKVGLPTPLNDPYAPWGRDNMEPYTAWIDLFNQKGFQVNGRTYTFKLVAVDDRNSPEGGSAAAKELVYGEGVKFVAGHWSWSYDAISAVTNPQKVIFVTRNGGGIYYDPLRQPYNVFGTPSREVWVGGVLAAHEKYPDKKVGILEPDTGLTASEMEAISRQYFDPSGMSYFWQVYRSGTTDFTPYIEKFAEAGCSLVLCDAGFQDVAPFVKQCRDAGYKWTLGQAGGLADIDDYIGSCGFDAMQGLIGSYFGIWDFQRTKVNPEYIAMCRQVMDTLSARHGKPYNYNDWIGWLPSHLLMLAQAMQKAGSATDTDVIMQAIRGGTFDTTAGTFRMSGEKTYGSPVVFGSPGAICHIQGNSAEYLAEHPVTYIP